MAIRIKPKLLLLLIAAAILPTGTAFAADPGTDDKKASQQAVDTLRVHNLPADHQSRLVVDQLRDLLSGKAGFAPQTFEQERLANGLVRMRVGVEGLNLAILTTDPEQGRVAACVQKPVVEPRPEKSESPMLFSLPATEGWVER